MLTDNLHLQKNVYYYFVHNVFIFRFFATGESFRSLEFSYRKSPSEITKIVPRVLIALQEKLMAKYLPPPNAIDWNHFDDFWERWDFPNLVGALDGKHVRKVAPYNTGNLFFNCKKYFAIVLFALVDASCKFVILLMLVPTGRKEILVYCIPEIIFGENYWRWESYFSFTWVPTQFKHLAPTCCFGRWIHTWWSVVLNVKQWKNPELPLL